MTGFHVNADALDRHAKKVEAIGADVTTAAAAEVAGTAQADFGILIGQTLGYGIRGLADHFHDALAAMSSALGSTAEGLHGNAANYRDADAASKHGVTSSGDGL